MGVGGSDSSKTYLVIRGIIITFIGCILYGLAIASQVIPLVLLLKHGWITHNSLVFWCASWLMLIYVVASTLWLFGKLKKEKN